LQSGSEGLPDHRHDYSGQPVAGTSQLERGMGGVTRPARPNPRALVCQKDAAASARRGRVWLQLATQTQHLNIDAAAENVLVHARRRPPMFPAQRPSGRFQECHQQGERALHQRHLLPRRIAQFLTPLI
jgi:hypothetical protein